MMLDITYPESPRMMTLSSTFFLDVIVPQLQGKQKVIRGQENSEITESKLERLTQDGWGLDLTQVMSTRMWLLKKTKRHCFTHQRYLKLILPTCKCICRLSGNAKRMPNQQYNL